LLLTTACLLTPEPELQAHYFEEGKNAFKAKDYAAAMTCFDRLAHLGSERPEILYQLALTADALGQRERATGIIQELAPASGGGYAQAHLWQAGRGLMPGASDQSREAVEGHLLKALDGELEDRDVAHALLGRLYLARGDLDQAQIHLGKAVKRRPHLRLSLAQLHARRGDKDRARREADLAIGYFRARAKADLHDHHARLLWAEATAFIENFPSAIAILTEGLSATGASEYRQGLAGVYLVWLDFISRDPKVKLEQQLTLVQNGLYYDPANVALLNRLLGYLKLGGSGAEQARAALRSLLAQGKARAAAHFALGVDAWENGKENEARLHWERAYKLNPQVPTVANNLAWLLAHSQAADLPRALKMINLVIERFPREVAYRETRGQILVKMGKWKEAIDDLEMVLDKNSDDPKLHGVLADAYRHLGDTAMANEHKSRATHAQPAKVGPEGRGQERK
jgi:tetratricopeptide (TPR) repeat protein